MTRECFSLGGLLDGGACERREEEEEEKEGGLDGARGGRMRHEGVGGKRGREEKAGKRGGECEDRDAEGGNENGTTVNMKRLLLFIHVNSLTHTHTISLFTCPSLYRNMLQTPISLLQRWLEMQISDWRRLLLRCDCTSRCLPQTYCTVGLHMSSRQRPTDVCLFRAHMRRTLIHRLIG